MAASFCQQSDSSYPASVNREGLAVGVAACIIYLVIGWLTASGGSWLLRPIFDGLAPPPDYRWVSPPEELADDNKTPARGKGTIPFEAAGSAARSITTHDGQASVVFPAGALATQPEQASVEVNISPRDPVKAAPAPEDLTFDGNAYAVDANYQPSGQPATLSSGQQPSVVLRYPIFATRILQLNDSAWETLPSNAVPQSLQVFANVDSLGIFVAAGPPRPSPPRRGTTPWWAYGVAGAGLLAVSLGAFRARRSNGGFPRSSVAKPSKKSSRRRSRR